MTSEEVQRQIEAAPKVDLGPLLKRVTRFNEGHQYGLNDVRGVTNTKEIAGTKANVSDRSLETFLVVCPEEFVFNRRVHGTGARRLGLGFNTTAHSFIFTNDYVAFKVTSDKLLPHFLFLYFLREDFNRYVVTNSWGSATEFFNWEDMCRVKIPLPPIEVQRAYVNAYKGLTALIEQNEALLKTLEQAAQACVAECKDKWPMVELQNMIAEVNERNSDMALSSEDVVGIATSKEFIGTKADLTGVNVKGYKIVEEKDFAFVSDTSRRGDKMSLAFNSLGRKILVTSIATVLRVTRLDQLCPEYLFLQFKRPEFDRYARFNSWGSARETFNWEDMCRVKIPLPPIEVQRAIVALYHCAEEARKIAEEAKVQLVKICPAMIQQASHRC
ncbi:MAG: restriction endonuclease subunit S [Sutterella sp.]|nr:restriction endonuclease subunit S [Sutterella sp.]